MSSDAERSGIDAASNTPDNRPPRFFHVWRCETIKDAPDTHPRAQKPPCGKWSVKASKHALGADKHLQGNCPHCGRRGRLNKRYVKSCETRAEANEICAVFNREGME